MKMKKSYIIIIAILLIIIQAIVLLFIGQLWICECKYIKFWEGDISSSGSSQHIADWYTFSHIIHGLVFYGILWLIFPKMPIHYRFLLALGMEVSWEIFENTPLVINAYRQQALAQGYIGDSILNSVFDTLFTLLGFGFAMLMPVWTSFVFVIAIEVFVAYSIHDNLTLNIINFIYQFEFIRLWQTGG